MAALIRRMHRGLVGSIALALTAAPPATPVRAQVPAAPAAVEATSRPDAHRPRDLVVLVHGMGRSSFSMRPLALALEAEGYEVERFGYSSLCCDIPELGERLRARVEARADSGRLVHFVGHSLGNILVRWVLTRDTLPARIGRVVMLAPPNQGARAADRFAGIAGWFLKPLEGLTTDPLATVRALPPVRGVEIGVISARDDRTVRLVETHLPEETAHIVVGGGHSFIMRRAEVKERTIEFLRTGRFSLAGPVVVDP